MKKLKTILCVVAILFVNLSIVPQHSEVFGVGVTNESSREFAKDLKIYWEPKSNSRDAFEFVIKHKSKDVSAKDFGDVSYLGGTISNTSSDDNGGVKAYGEKLGATYPPNKEIKVITSANFLNIYTIINPGEEAIIEPDVTINLETPEELQNYLAKRFGIIQETTTTSATPDKNPEDEEAPDTSLSQTTLNPLPLYNFTQDLMVGSTGPTVESLQNFLIQEGFLVMPVGVSTGYFGELTRSALARWQSMHGISPAVGYFGLKTRTAVNLIGTAMENSQSNATTGASSCIDITEPIYFSEQNQNISKIQQFLVSKGYLTMPAGTNYGYYGNATASALSRFMSSRGLNHNGAVIDVKTLGEIKKVSC